AIQPSKFLPLKIFLQPGYRADGRKFFWPPSAANFLLVPQPRMNIVQIKIKKLNVFIIPPVCFI
ncbi:MAG: hypothetical protein ABIN74_12400, partial [Ferruginibacter sp.]